MTDDDVFNGSTTALSFEKFIAKINQESARDLVKNINMYDFKKLGCGLILLIQYPPPSLQLHEELQTEASRCSQRQQ